VRECLAGADCEAECTTKPSPGGACGNAIVEGDEACDDGKRDVGEQCDDGNMKDDDFCRNDCTLNGGATGAGGASASAGPTAAVTSTSSGGGFGCDTGQVGMNQSQLCTDCLNCASTSTCANETAICGPGSACDSFVSCRVQCLKTSDTNQNNQIDVGNEVSLFESCVGSASMPVVTGCTAAYPKGAKDYDTWVTCIYDECPSNCGKGKSELQVCDSGFAHPVKECADCLTKFCCVEAKACSGSVDCVNCVTKSDVSACDKVTQDEAFDTCLMMKCSLDCT